MTVRSALTAVAAGVGVLAVVSCAPGDRAWGGNLLGVAAARAQPGVTIAVYSCPGMPLQGASMHELDSRGNVQSTLWQIHRISPGPDPAELSPGVVPAGFAQDVALQQPRPGARLDVQVVQGGYTNGLDFRLRQLDATSLLVDGSWFGGHSQVSRRAFADANAKKCTPRSS